MPGLQQHREHVMTVGVALRILALLGSALLDLLEDQFVSVLALTPEGRKRSHARKQPAPPAVNRQREQADRFIAEGQHVPTSRA